MGVTDKIDSFLTEVKGKKIFERVILSESRALQLGLSFKTYSSFMAIATLKEYIYDNEKKDIKSTIGFVNDLTGLSSGIIGILQNEKFENLAQALVNRTNKKLGNANLIKINLSNNQFLSASAGGLAKVSAYAVIIMTILDTIKYEKNEDYDALAATVALLSLNIVGLFIGGTTLGVVLALSAIAYIFVMTKLIDTPFETYLKKSLFYNKEKYDGKNYKAFYPAKYLLETTRKNKELKEINDTGFNSAKDIFDFIGKNYKTYKNYFDIALTNEISFLKSALYGYKLDVKKLETHQRVKTVSGLELSFYSYHGLMIPKELADDKEFKLFFAPYGSEYLEISKTSLITNNGMFDFFPEYNSYFNLNTFSNKIKKQTHTSYVIVLSSQIELKYKIEFIDSDKTTPNNHIHIDSLEHISFNVEDEKIIKGKE